MTGLPGVARLERRDFFKAAGHNLALAPINSTPAGAA